MARETYDLRDTVIHMWGIIDMMEAAFPRFEEAEMIPAAMTAYRESKAEFYRLWSEANALKSVALKGAVA